MPMIAGLIFLPLVAGAVAFAVRNNAVRRGLLVATAAAHTGLTAKLWADWPARPDALLNGWLAADAPGLVSAVPRADDRGGPQPAPRAAVGRGRGDHAGPRPADLLPPPPPVARSHLEVPAHLLGRAGSGDDGQLRPGRVDPGGRRQVRGDQPPPRRLATEREEAQPHVAPDRVRILPGRVRDEDGAGPAAHLAPGRPQRGSVAGVGA